MKIDKKTLQWAGLIVVLIVIFALVSLMKQKQVEQLSNELNSQSQNDPNQSTTTEESEAPRVTAITLSGGVRPKEPTATQNYNAALKTYTYRFQFSKCLATPGEITVKKGTKVMLDNRDSTAHTFKVGGKSVRIDGYYFAVMTAGETGNFTINCDGNGRAEILIQK